MRIRRVGCSNTTSLVANDEGEQLPGGYAPSPYLLQRAVYLDAVLIAATDPLALDVAGRLQIGHDLPHCPLGNADRLRDLESRARRSLTEVRQYERVVGKEAPGGHGLSLSGCL